LIKLIKIFKKISSLVSGFGVPEPTNPNQTKPIRFRNKKNKPSRRPAPPSH
jgi:hypothetical protein